ncbi:hypothetical protein N7931_18885, partial [Catenovulum sp. 2E275]|uniref:hypothetical protein n=1 Tax=Catenovulum sp. 2E275 TaxID=2980497 RepID=UPI0021D38642
FQPEKKMHETRQIVVGIVALHQNNLAQYQAFLARPFGSFTALPLLRHIGLKGAYIPSPICFVLKAL